MDTTARARATLRTTRGRNLREARERHGYSQADLARLMTTAGYLMRQQTIARIETGERDVSVDEAAALAEITGLELAIVTRPSELRIARMREAAAIEEVRQAEEHLDRAQAALDAARARVAELGG